MNDKFGQFEWHCYKDKQPEEKRFLYVYFSDTESDVDIYVTDCIDWDETVYWCYVFMPDPPKIDKKKTLEDRIYDLEKVISELTTNIDCLPKRFR